MTCNTIDLINDLTERTLKIQSALKNLETFSIDDLNKRDHPDAWSAFECIAHLNIYGDFYIPEITKKIAQSGNKIPSTVFKSGILGNYFVKMVGPLDASKKMKTLSSANPLGSALNISTLHKFDKQQSAMLEILKNAATVNLNKTRTGISIAPWIKIKLGDTLRVVILHNQRHMEQALRAVK